MHACLSAYVLYGRPAGPITTKLNTWIHLDPGSVLVKSRSKSMSRGKRQ